jgi:hypothetical protein
MQVISVAFILAMFRFWELATELLEIPEREVFWNDKSLNETYRFFKHFSGLEDSI